MHLLQSERKGTNLTAVRQQWKSGEPGLVLGTARLVPSVLIYFHKQE